jgi:DNA-binding response OmpR family regulator
MLSFPHLFCYSRESGNPDFAVCTEAAVWQYCLLRLGGKGGYMRILLIENDKADAELVRDCLAQLGHAVEVAETGEDGEPMAELVGYDLFIIAIILSGKNGLDVCQSLRHKDILTPILILTCLDTEESENKTLNLGADDYMTKPFHVSNLYAHVGALLRRAPYCINPQLKAGSLVLDTVSREVWSEGLPLKIIGKECELLELLMRNQNAVSTRRIIDDKLYDLTLDVDSNAINQHVRNLRAKLFEADPKGLIETIRGVGYRLNIRNIFRENPLPCAIILLYCLFWVVDLPPDWLTLTCSHFSPLEVSGLNIGKRESFWLEVPK